MVPHLYRGLLRLRLELTVQLRLHPVVLGAAPDFLFSGDDWIGDFHGAQATAIAEGDPGMVGGAPWREWGADFWEWDRVKAWKWGSEVDFPMQVPSIQSAHAHTKNLDTSRQVYASNLRVANIKPAIRKEGISMKVLQHKIWMGALVAASALPIAAAITVDQNTFSGRTYTTYVDFSATTSEPNHPNYSTFAAGEHFRNVTPKYFDLNINASSQGGDLGGCFEIGTLPAASGLIADTEILARILSNTNPGNNTEWQRLSDDVDGTTYSKARLFFEDFVDISHTVIRIAMFDGSATNNKAQFKFYVKPIAPSEPGVTKIILTEADCFSPSVSGAGSDEATAFIDRHENVLIRHVH